MTPESDKKRALKNKDTADKEEDKPEAVPAHPAHEPEQHVKQPRKKRKSQKDASEHAVNKEKTRMIWMSLPQGQTLNLSLLTKGQV